MPRVCGMYSKTYGTPTRRRDAGCAPGEQSDVCCPCEETLRFACSHTQLCHCAQGPLKQRCDEPSAWYLHIPDIPSVPTHTHAIGCWKRVPEE